MAQPAALLAEPAAACLVPLAVWLGFITLFLVDTQTTLRFVGRYADPAVRLGWHAVLLGVPVVTLVLSPLWRWAALVLALAAALALALHCGAYGALRRRLTAAPAGVADRVRSLARAFGLRRPFAVLYDPADRLDPATVGILRTALVLTPSVVALPEADFRAIVAHELAHIARRDPLRLWACGIVRALLGWHPLVRRAAEQYALEVEMAADRQAADWTGDRRAYALALGRWALGRHGAGRPLRGGAFAFASASSGVVQRLAYLADADGAAPHVVPPLGLGAARPGSRWAASARWGHLAMGLAYTLLFAAVARLF